MNIGERVRQARETLHYTQEELGELTGLGLDRFAILSIEKGERSVKAEELYEFARVLERSLVYFLRDEPAPESIVAHRGNAPENREAIVAELRLHRWVDDYAEVAQLVDADFLAQLGEGLAYPPRRGSDIDRASAAAQRQRELLRLGSDPIASLGEIIEYRLGLPIFGHPVTDTNFCGVLLMREHPASDGIPLAAILVNTNLSRPRSRFTVAHELGHLILRRSAKDYSSHAWFRRDPRDTKQERFANAFAAELLAPIEVLREHGAAGIDKSDPDTIMALAVRFGVSFQMMTWRLATLGSFDEPAAQELIASVSPTRLSSFRQARQEFDVLSPRLCEYVARAYTEGLLPEGRCAEMLGMTTLGFVEMMDDMAAECAAETAFDAAG